jgi:probable HAF family extracellular repeat protein
MRRAATILVKALRGASVFSFLATVGWSQQPSITWLGVPSGVNDSQAYGVSADGSVVVGSSWNNGNSLALRWTQATGWQDLGMPEGFIRAEAFAVSGDGSIVVGYIGDGAARWNGFRWTQATGMQDLGAGEAYGISADGSVIVGEQGRWTQATGWQAIGGSAYAATPDGSVIVGRGYDSNTEGMRAFRWTQATELQFLGTLSGTSESVAHAVSADGSVVVGVAVDDSGQFRAFRWTESGGMEALCGSEDDNCEVYGVSADGTIVVGSFNGSAFRWTQATGMQDLNEVYASLLNGGFLGEARAITPDGRYIVGVGYYQGRRQGFLLDTGTTRRDGDVNGDGCVDDSDLLQVLFAFGNTGANLPEDLNGDSTVDDADLLEVLFNFGSGC